MPSWQRYKPQSTSFLKMIEVEQHELAISKRKWMSGRGRKVMQRYSALPVDLGSCSLQGLACQYHRFRVREVMQSGEAPVEWGKLEYRSPCSMSLSTVGGAVSAVEQYISRGAVSAVEQYISRGASVRLAGTDLGIMNEALKTICETGVFTNYHIGTQLGNSCMSRPARWSPNRPQPDHKERILGCWQPK
ncbi:Uncharacterized protein HZ326_2785 [Fusarium oxysporum f. sp. albedinis]|nr:Uncharacterized protein HZ326_2785 [Fusarium oxysporum f. sp. albedinis]